MMLNNHFSNQVETSNQVEIIEECKNSLNELIKASKWSTTTGSQTLLNNNETSKVVVTVNSSPPAIQTRFKYLEKSKLGTFPSNKIAAANYLMFDQQNDQNKSRFNNYDNLVETAAPKLAPLATTSEMDDNFSVTNLAIPQDETTYNNNINGK